MKSKTHTRERDVIAVASKRLNASGVSVEWFGEIAADLGISRPALYNYAVDRDDLLFKCYSRSCDLFEQALGEADAAPADAAQILDRFQTATNSRHAPEAAVLSELDALAPDRRLIIRSRRDALARRLQAVVERGIAARIFRPVDPAVIGEAVLSMASWAPLYRRWRPRVRGIDCAAGFREMLFLGLAADRAAAHAKPDCYAPTPPAAIDPFDRGTLEVARREAILAAASALFSARGAGATRVEDVAAALGLSKRAIYHQFGHKEALVDACVERAYRFNLGVMEAAEQLPATRLEALFAAVRDVAEAAGNPHLAVMVPYVWSGQMSSGRRAAMDDYSQRLADGYRRILVQGEREDSLRASPIEDVLASLPGVFAWVANRPSATAQERRRIADELATLVTRGLLA